MLHKTKWNEILLALFWPYLIYWRTHIYLTVYLFRYNVFCEICVTDFEMKWYLRKLKYIVENLMQI